jgi:hypothetical protein
MADDSPTPSGEGAPPQAEITLAEIPVSVEVVGLPASRGRDIVEVAQGMLADSQAVVARGKQIARDAKTAFKRIRAAVDPREVAGGLAGLTAGEVMGGAIGGVVGTLVAGPFGTALGAEVGAFTGGMLGMKLGADAVTGLVEKQQAVPSAKPKAKPKSEKSKPTNSPAASVKPENSARMGEIVGLASGASLGRLVAGPVGGLVGAVVGEVIGGQVAKDRGAAAERQPAAPQSQIAAGTTVRLNRLGKRVAGESATILVGGAVGSIFGAGGRVVGRRVGFVIARQIEWDKLTDPLSEDEPAAAPRPATVQATAVTAPARDEDSLAVAPAEVDGAQDDAAPEIRA